MITEYDPTHYPNWPKGWGEDFTERDHAGIHLDRVLGEMRVPVRGLVARGLTPVNLQDYRSAANKGWGSGWPQCGGAAGNIVTVTAAVSGARFNVHRRVSVLFDHLIDRMENRGYLCKPSQCGAYNCFAAETLVMTPDGDVPIGDLAGTTARLLTRRGTGRAAGGPGRWVDAEVREFGVQPLRRVVLTRRGIEREVYATPGHRWLLDEPDRANQQRTTDELRPGHRLASIHPQSVATRVGVSAVGAAHGIVYGDGTVTRDEARVMLCGPKNAPLLRYFADPHVHAYPEGLLVGRLPKSWKRMPSLDEGSSYLYGFLAGYFAADGDVTANGMARLSSADREALERVRVICTRLGIVTTGIVTTKRLGYGDEVSALYSITLSGRTLTDEFFLIPEHRERFVAAPKRYAPARWSVVRVEETSRVEPVYCAVVPETECFALADNLLTGNCRAIGGTQVASNHSWGLAADVNWNDNPFTSGTSHSMPLWVPREIFNPYGWAWGGDYTGSKRDYMHLEFLGSPTQADEQTQRILAEGRPVTPPVPTGDHPVGSRVMYLTDPHMEGDDVNALQARLNRDYPSYSKLVVDGDFGQATDSTVREFQRRAGLAVDGEVGPSTLKALHLI
jgi:hypothetical protein